MKAWTVVLTDCHDAVLKICSSEEVAFAWRDFYRKQKGTECAEVRGAYNVEDAAPLGRLKL